MDQSLQSCDEDGIMVLVEETSAKSSPVQAVAILVNTAVGAGVLSLPYAFSCAGWAGGLLILCTVAAAESFTLYVLARWAEQTGASSYSELVHKQLGIAASVALALTLLLYLFGSGVAYLVIIGDTVHPVLFHLFGETFWTGRTAVISGVGIFLILPLCLPSSLSAVAAISTVNLFAFLAVIGAVLVRSGQSVMAAADPWANVHAFSPSFMAAVPIAVFGLQCHAQVVAVFEELDDLDAVPTLWQLLGVAAQRQPGASSSATSLHDSVQEAADGESSDVGAAWRLRRRRKSIKLLGMTRVIITAIGVTAAGYAVVGLSAYLAFPTTLSSNILNTFPPSDPVMQVARAVVGVLEIASYPVNHFPSRAAMRDLLQHATGRRVGGPAFNAMEALAFFFGTLAVALSVTNLGSVFSMVGGTCGSVIILGLPGSLLISYSWGKHQRSRQGLGGPLLAAGGPSAEEELYHMWQSKLFAAGLGLCLGCAALFAYTILSILP